MRRQPPRGSCGVPRRSLAALAKAAWCIGGLVARLHSQSRASAALEAAGGRRSRGPCRLHGWGTNVTFVFQGRALGPPSTGAKGITAVPEHGKERLVESGICT